ncbi:hypothetical protein [Methylobacter svalbardensis]|uniref:hypothetical protein n=1 Tax=Methylobacter svalbardensis TaxID=3080016 RepID=UPI0030EE4FE8
MTTKYTPLKDHDTPIKVLFTGYLCTVAIGYFFALIQILFTHGMADGKFGLSVDDIVYSYYGNRSGTVLEQKLNGSMKDKAPELERFKIMEWVREGADIDAYKDEGVDKIIESRCVMCHNKEASGIPDFTDFAALKALSEQDTGATFASLTRVSHVHMFGISFIFMFVGLIFSFSETTTTQYKCIAIGMPYAFLVADILSWWLTKINPMFAWLVIFAGMGMGVSFMFMWVTSILEMWLFKPVFINGLGARYLQRRDSTEASFVDRTWFYLKLLAKQIKPAAAFVTEQWLTRGLPVVKGWLKKYRK